MTATTSTASLLIACHGAKGVPLTVTDHADILRATGGFAGVHPCALRTEPMLEHVAEVLPEGPVVLVPYLMAEGYTLNLLSERLAALPIAARTTVCRAVGAHPEMAALLRRKGERACTERDWPAAETGFLLVGHGTPRNKASAATAEAQAERIAAAGTFAAVRTAFLEQAPSVAEALSGDGPAHWVVVGFFTDAGEHGRDDVPELLAETHARTVYAGPVGPDPGMAELIRHQAEAALD